MLYFLSFLCSHQDAPKDNDEERGGSRRGTHLADTALIPQLLQLIVENSYLLPNNPDVLRLQSQPEKMHPISKIRPGVFRVSGNRLKKEAYQTMLSKYSSPRGGNQQRNSIGHFNKNGCFFSAKTN